MATLASGSSVVSSLVSTSQVNQLSVTLVKRDIGSGFLNCRATPDGTNIVPDLTRACCEAMVYEIVLIGFSPLKYTRIGDETTIIGRHLCHLPHLSVI